MPQQLISPPSVSRHGTAQLQLVRRYARILRETTAQTSATRRAAALRPEPRGPSPSDR